MVCTREHLLDEGEGHMSKGGSAESELKGSEQQDSDTQEAPPAPGSELKVDPGIDVESVRGSGEGDGPYLIPGHVR